MAEQVRAEAVVRRHQRMLRSSPRRAREAERLGVERAHRAQVDDVARQLVIHGLLDVACRISMFSPRPIVPSSWKPAISSVKRTQRVQWMQRVMSVDDQRAEVLVLAPRACAR